MYTLCSLKGPNSAAPHARSQPASVETKAASLRQRMVGTEGASFTACSVSSGRFRRPWVFPTHERPGIPAGQRHLQAHPSGFLTQILYPVSRFDHAYPPLSAARVTNLPNSPWLRPLAPSVRRCCHPLFATATMAGDFSRLFIIGFDRLLSVAANRQRGGLEASQVPMKGFCMPWFIGPRDACLRLTKCAVSVAFDHLDNSTSD